MSNDRSQGNAAGALRIGQSYAQPLTPSERIRALTEENAELRTSCVRNERTVAMLSQQVGILKTNQQPKGDHMAEEFKSGDVVKLKSGGPKMTVRNRTALPATNYSLASSQGWGAAPSHAFVSPVTCDWFAGDHAQRETFEARSLRSIGDPEPA